MPRLKRLSQKQKGFCKSYVETNGNNIESALQNYNCGSRNMASVIAVKNLDRKPIQEEIERLMEAKEVTNDLMIDKLKEGMEANVVATFQGDATESDIPDHDKRFKWWDAAAKIKGLYPAQETINKNLNLDVQLETMSKEELSKLLKGLLTSLKKEQVEEPKQ